MRWLLPVLLVLCALPAQAAERRFALVIGSTRTPEGMAPLKYADDDAVLYLRLFEAAGYDRVVLLTLADAETQRRHPDAAAAAKPATRQAVERALDGLFAEIREAAKAGDSTDLVFAYAGHGVVGEDGQGALLLEDGRFTRTDLYETVVKRSPAEFNHLLLDACAAYFVVQKRGEEDAPSSAVARLTAALSTHELSAHPGTGALVSTSSGAAVHEWSGFEAGIFSHLVRSAMRGAADVDGDGAITYGEVAAYLAASREGVTDPEARIEPYVAAPARDLRRPLLRLTDARPKSFLSLAPELSGKGYLEDDDGARLADFHKARGVQLALLLPQGTSFLVFDGRLTKLATDSEGVVDPSALPSEPIALLPRSTGEAVAARLLAAPFGWEFYRGFLSSTPGLGAASLPGTSFTDVLPRVEHVAEEPTRLAPFAWLAVGTAVVAGGGSALAGSMAQRSFDSYLETIAREGFVDKGLASEVRVRRNVSNALLGTAVISGGVAALLFFLDSDDPEPSVKLAGSSNSACGSRPLCLTWDVLR